MKSIIIQYLQQRDEIIEETREEPYGYRGFLQQLNSTDGEQWTNSGTQMTPKVVHGQEVQTDPKRGPGRPRKIIQDSSPNQIRKPPDVMRTVTESTINQQRTISAPHKPKDKEVEDMVKQVQQMSEIMKRVHTGRPPENRSTLIPILVVLLMTLCNTPSSSATVAYDCSTPSQGPKYSLRETEECPEAVPNKMITSKTQSYFVYQESDFLRTTALECIVKRSQAAWYCGRSSYTAMVVPTTAYLPIQILPDVCRAAFQTGEIRIDESLKIKAKSGTAIYERITRNGHVEGDGTCSDVKPITVAGVTVSNAVVIEDYFVELKEYQVTFDAASLKMMGRTYCDGTKTSCSTGDSIITYKLDHQECKLTLLMETSFKEIYGEMYQDANPFEQGTLKPNRSKLWELQNNRTNEKLRTTKTPTLLIADRPSDMIRVVLKDATSRCGRVVTATNYPNLFVTQEAVPGAKPKMDSRDIDLAKYFNNKMDYLYHHNLLTTASIYQKSIENDCKLNREILRTKLALTITNSDITAPLLPLPEGTFARVMGEVIHTYKCKKVRVELAAVDECTNELPVMYQGQQVYLEPVTRVIISNPIGIKKLTCSNVLAPMYEWGDGNWITLPDRKRTTAPEKLEMMKLVQPHRFQEFLNTQEGGIYDIKDINAARKFLLFPEKRARVLTEMVYRALEGGGGRPDFELLLHPDHFKKATQKTMEKMWGRFLVFGQLTAGFIGVYVIMVFIKTAFSQILNTLHIYQIAGLTWKLVLGCCPLLAKHVLFQLNLKELRKKGNRVDDPRNELSMVEIKQLTDKPKNDSSDDSDDNRPGTSKQHYGYTTRSPRRSPLRSSIRDRVLTPPPKPKRIGLPMYPDANRIREDFNRTLSRNQSNFMNTEVSKALMRTNVIINGKKAIAIIDTGSTITMIQDKPGLVKNRLNKQQTITLNIADGTQREIRDVTIIQITIMGTTFIHKAYIHSYVPGGCLVGLDLIKKLHRLGIRWYDLLPDEDPQTDDETQTIETHSVNVNSTEATALIQIPVTIKENTLIGILDTGATMTIIQERYLTTEKVEIEECLMKLVNNTQITFIKSADITLIIMGESYAIKARFLPDIPFPCIIGLDVIKQLHKDGVPWYNLIEASPHNPITAIPRTSLKAFNDYNLIVGSLLKIQLIKIAELEKERQDMQIVHIELIKRQFEVIEILRRNICAEIFKTNATEQEDKSSRETESRGTNTTETEVKSTPTEQQSIIIELLKETKDEKITDVGTNNVQRRKRQLKPQNQYHYEANEYTCNICNKIYASRPGVMRHWDAQHAPH